MSFSAEIKDELCRIRQKNRVARLAQLSGLTQTAGTLRLSRTPSVFYQSESAAVIKNAASLAEELYPLDAVFTRKEQEHRRLPLSVVTLSGTECRQLLLDTGVLSLTEDGSIGFPKEIPAALTASEEARRAFLRGCFLGGGSCCDPARGYHLEIAARTEHFSGQLVPLIGQFSLTARHMERKGRHIVYLKGDDVSGFLALMGASAAALRFEDVRTERDYRNYINRTSNCETANIDKTVTAGLLQLQAIERIEERASLEALPAPLYEAARLRLSHPDATLQELADMAEIGKSGMNHRFARLIALAKELEG